MAAPGCAFSVMPPQHSRLLDSRTSPVEQRIAAAADVLGAGRHPHRFTPVGTDLRRLYQGARAQMVLPPSGVGSMCTSVARWLISCHPQPPVPSVWGGYGLGGSELVSVTHMSM